MKAGGKGVYLQKGIDREEVKKAIKKVNCGKAAGVHGITPGMLK